MSELAVQSPCQEVVQWMHGQPFATKDTQHKWRFYGYAPPEEGGKEIWYCERCRKIEKRWPQIS